MGTGTESGRSGREGRSGARVARPLAASLAALLAGGCATTDPAAVRAEREAALARWSGCVARHAGRGATADEALEATRVGCDGHRRDVAMTFPPHLGDRVRARLDAGERRHVVHERLDLDRAALGDRSVSPDDWLERLLVRTADERRGGRGGGREDGRGDERDAGGGAGSGAGGGADG